MQKVQFLQLIRNTSSCIKVRIIKVGASKEMIDSQMYKVPITDNYGNTEFFYAVGIEKISNNIESNDVSSVARLLGRCSGGGCEET